jgi:hypothetical protein
VSLFTNIWILLTTSLIFVVGSRKGFIPNDAGIWWLTGIMLAAVSWQFLAVTLKAWFGYKSVPVLATALLAAIILTFPVAGAVFRLMGIGGGIQISATVSVPGEASQLPQNRLVDGCLVMWLGNQISIQASRDSDRRIIHCHISPLTPVKQDGVVVPTMVHTLVRSDILDIYSQGAPPSTH